jgi:hypothetical protein
MGSALGVQYSDKYLKALPYPLARLIPVFSRSPTSKNCSIFFNCIELTSSLVANETVKMKKCVFDILGILLCLLDSRVI